MQPSQLPYMQIFGILLSIQLKKYVCIWQSESVKTDILLENLCVAQHFYIYLFHKKTTV